MEYLSELEITAGETTYIVRLEQIQSRMYICREVVDGEPKQQLFWLPKLTSGIPTEAQASYEIEREFRRIRRLGNA